MASSPSWKLQLSHSPHTHTHKVMLKDYEECPTGSFIYITGSKHHPFCLNMLLIPSEVNITGMQDGKWLLDSIG